jgi:hypothetical protein
MTVAKKAPARKTPARKAPAKPVFTKFEWPQVTTVEELSAAIEANIEWAEGRRSLVDDPSKVNYWNGVIQNAKNMLINGVSQLLEDEGELQDEAG